MSNKTWTEIHEEFKAKMKEKDISKKVIVEHISVAKSELKCCKHLYVDISNSRLACSNTHTINVSVLHPVEALNSCLACGKCSGFEPMVIEPSEEELERQRQEEDDRYYEEQLAMSQFWDLEQEDLHDLYSTYIIQGITKTYRTDMLWEMLSRPEYLIPHQMNKQLCILKHVGFTGSENIKYITPLQMRGISTDIEQEVKQVLRNL